MRIKRFLVVIISLVMILTMFPVNSMAAKKVSLNKKTLNLREGSKYQLKLKNLGKGIKVSWSSNKKKVATVSKTGRVTAKKAGKAVITAKVKKLRKKYKCRVVVKKKKTTVTAVPKVTDAPIVTDVPQTEYINTSDITKIHNPIVNSESVTWSSIYFGNYYDSLGGTKKPIKWRVLSINNNEALIISEEGLDIQPYNVSSTDEWIRWDNCTLRSWLNGYSAGYNADGRDYTGENFIDKAFTEQEKLSILTSQISVASGTTEYVNDKVYILSENGLLTTKLGFSNWNGTTMNRIAGRAKGSSYVNEYIANNKDNMQGVKVNEEGYISWVLRDTLFHEAYSTSFVSQVSPSGIVSGGTTVMSLHMIRPAMHIDLSHFNWKNADDITEDTSRVSASTPKPTPTRKPTPTKTPVPTYAPWNESGDNMIYIDKDNSWCEMQDSVEFDLTVDSETLVRIESKYINQFGSVMYYVDRSGRTDILSEYELSWEVTWLSYDGPIKLGKGRNTVYARILDSNGEYSYLCSDGIVVEDAQTTVYYTDKGSYIINDANISSSFENVDEYYNTDNIKAKKMDFVDTKYWTDVYAENQAEAIHFQHAVIPGFSSTGRIEHASKDEEGRWVPDKNDVQAYAIWDEDYIYVLFDVNDYDIAPQKDPSAVRSYDVTDSVGITITENGYNNKIAVFVDAIDDAFSADYDGTAEYEYVAHATKLKKNELGNNIGYQVELIIPFVTKHQKDHIINMDFVVNDCFTDTVYEFINAEAIPTSKPQVAIMLKAFEPIAVGSGLQNSGKCYNAVTLGGKGAVELGLPPTLPTPKPTKKPVATPEPTPTVEPLRPLTPAVNQYFCWLSAYPFEDEGIISYDGGTLTAVRDEYGCCQGVIIPLGQNYQHGDTVEITVSGSSQGAVPRMWMTNWDDYANYSYHGLSYTNVISSEEFQFGVAHELEVYCDGANCIVLEYGLGDTGFDRLTIGSIIIAEGITSVPDVTPAPTTAPEWKEPYILLHDSNEAVYTLSNSVEYSEDGKAYVVLNHKDSGYGIGYYFKEDCSSINLNDYKIVVNISSESEFNVIFGTYNELKNDYWDYLINSTLGNQTYSYCDVGENEYEFEWNNDAKIFFMKLNNWVSNNEQGLSEDVKFTINSIKLVKK